MVLNGEGERRERDFSIAYCMELTHSPWSEFQTKKYVVGCKSYEKNMNRLLTNVTGHTLFYIFFFTVAL